jgi:hypothetical protein
VAWVVAWAWGVVWAVRGTSMSISVKIHELLLENTNQQEELKVHGNTVGKCLKQVSLTYPRMKEFLFTKDWKLRSCVEILVNGETPDDDVVNHKVKDQDTLYVMMMMGCVG